jgi:TFIIF-interacting CTD phosphatase-like protein
LTETGTLVKKPCHLPIWNSLENTIIIDDCPQVYESYSENTIKISRWSGDMGDRELEKILSTLEMVREMAQTVPEILSSLNLTI